ncbi:MAG: AAA family ATPase [Terriglobales bacterium]|jgi:predicted ATPase
MKKNAIKSLHIQNLLSFGEDSPRIELGDLNVLIGPNGSGKSNLIETIGLLRSTPKDFAAEVADSGGISELLWKGSPRPATATIEAISSPSGVNRTIRYRLAFTKVGPLLKIVDERIENEKPDVGHEQPYLYFDYNGGRPVLNVSDQQRHLRREEVNPQQSILSQRQDPDQYPEVTYLGRFFGSFRLYRNWDFGPDSGVRNLYGSELKTDFLEEDISNLGLMLNRLRGESKTDFLKYLKMFYEGAEDIYTKIVGGLVDLRLEEEGGISITASRLSDGTLRWLSLLTILLHPDPPPVVCIEEPELGLHPDVIRPLANLLRSASERMQLVVTTHSDALVDELSDVAAAVIVCEKHNGSSVLKQLDSDQLSDWLKRYTLGQLWHTGQIGGNRW